MKHGNILYVGITGKARHGKSTFTNVLLAEARPLAQMSLSFALMPISEPMKNLWWQQICGYDPRKCDALKETTYEPLGLEHRAVLESLGDWGRSVHKHFWLHRIERSLQGDQGLDHGIYDRKLTVVLIPDVRLEDEAEWIRERGGCVIHVHSNTLATINSTHTVQSNPLSHGRDDVLIINDGTIDDLREQAKAFLESRILGHYNGL